MTFLPSTFEEKAREIRFFKIFRGYFSKVNSTFYHYCILLNLSREIILLRDFQTGYF